MRTRFEAAPAPRSLDAGLKPHRRRVTVTKVSPYGDDGKRLREADMLVPERVRLGFFFRYVYEPERQEIVWPERPPTAEPPPRRPPPLLQPLLGRQRRHSRARRQLPGQKLWAHASPSSRRRTSSSSMTTRASGSRSTPFGRRLSGAYELVRRFVSVCQFDLKS